MAILLAGVEFTARFDERTLAQLASDTGAPIAAASIPSDDHILKAIEDAEGQVLAYLAKNGRISPSQILELNTLSKSTDPDLVQEASIANIQISYIKRIVADIAMFHMLQRRPSVNTKLFEQMEKIREGHLKDLQDGNSLLALDTDTECASRASVDGVSYNDLVSKNSVRIRAERYFCSPPLPAGRR